VVDRLVRTIGWLVLAPVRFLAWVYQPDDRDRAGIGDAAILREARSYRCMGGARRGGGRGVVDARSRRLMDGAHPA